MITVLFADDTTLIVAGHSVADISDTLSHALTSAHQWLSASGLQLNASKNKCMLVRSSRWQPQTSLVVQLGGTIIEKVQSYKFLGVMLNDTLTWSDHISLVCSKASKGLNLLPKIAWFLPKEALLCYYNAYILPQFTYTHIIWSTCTAAESARLECLQNYTACLILQRPWGVSATSTYVQGLGLAHTGLASRRKLSEVVTPFCCISGHSPPYLSSLLRPVVLLHSRGTRSASSNGLHLPNIKTGFEKKTLPSGELKTGIHCLPS